MQKRIKIAYIGGGSKQWARVFMSDLAATEGLGGEIALYDIDREAAARNARIGSRTHTDPAAKSVFHYTVSDTLEQAQQAQRIAETIEMAQGLRPFPVSRSTEEAAELMKALLGFGTIVSNVNLPNRGQMSQLPLGSIVETNCVFSNDMVRPVVSSPLPEGAAELVARNCSNIDLTYEGIRSRDPDIIFRAFASQPLCEGLPPEKAGELFREMCFNTREYLDPWYDLEKYFG